MILTFRDLNDKLEIINNGVTLECEQCELAQVCPKQDMDRLGISDLPEESEVCYLNGGNGYNTLIDCGSSNVSDGIGDHYEIDPYDFLNEDDPYEDSYETNNGKWEPAQPVFISAQTGSGKNYFIENILSPHVKQLNYDYGSKFKILIISNRRALKAQIKNHLKGASDASDDESFFSYNDFVDVVTYQGILAREKYFKRVQKKRGEQYIYIICDESHFFTSDAMFNPDTGRILSAIVDTFQNAIRIYMSATPYECLRYIVDKESQYYSQKNEKLLDNQIVFYRFTRDHSYLNITTYSKTDELYEIIRDSVDHKKRWMIFIDNKDKCTSVSKALQDKQVAKDRILVVNANSKSDEKFAALVESEKLDKDTYVLISTSVLDNGVNLSNIDNIVVSDMNQIKCMQMVGRARKTLDSQINLYIKRLDMQDIRRKINESERQMDAYHDFDLAFGDSNIDHRKASDYSFRQKYYESNEENWRIAKALFGIDKDNPSEYYYNKIARSLFEGRRKVYPLIKKQMEQEDPSKGADADIHVGQSYLEYQLSWFGKDYSIDDDLTYRKMEKELKTLINYLEKHKANGTIFESDKQKQKRITEKNQAEDDKKYGSQGEFRAEFTKLAITIQGEKTNHRPDDYGIKAINDILDKLSLSYIVDNKSKIGGWRVIEYNRESEATGEESFNEK